MKPLPPGYGVRPALREDLAALPAIEREAGRLFEGVPGITLVGVLDDVTPARAFTQACDGGWLFVATAPDGAPVGFALVEALDGSAHLDELDVLPGHGRRGLGAALVGAVRERARQRGFRALTLTTFRDVPWNEPFYARLGFRRLAQGALSPELEAVRREEDAAGLRAAERVVMRLDLAAPQEAP